MAALLALCLVLAQAPQEVAAWSRFRGPNGTGIAAGVYPAEIGPGESVLWVQPVPPGHSSPVLSRARVFLTGLEGEALVVLALERDTGALAWKREAPRPRRTRFHADNHAAAPSAAVDADTVVVFFDEFGLLAFDHDGAERWRVPLGPFDNVYGLGASPILAGETVLLACDQSTGSFLLAVSKRDGKELWRAPRPQAVSGHCTPVLWEGEHGVEVLLPGSFLLDAYDVRSGERLWWIGGLPAEMKSVPVVLEDRLWLHGYNSPLNELENRIELPPFAEALAELDADRDGTVSAAELPDERLRGYFEFYDLVPDLELDASEWETLRASLGALNSAQCLRLGGGRGDLGSTSVAWRYHRGIPQLPSPLVYGGVYWMLADSGGLLTQLDPDTGALLGKERMSQGLDAYYAAPVAGDGKVYLLGQTGTLNVIAAEKGLEVLHVARFGETCYATPALEDGRIWLRTEKRLYCFGAAETR